MKTLFARLGLALAILLGTQTAWADDLSPNEALRYGIKNNNPADIRLAFLRGAEPNSRFANGDTPLTFAFRSESYDAVDALLQNPKVSVVLENRMGESPLMMAVFREDEKHFDALLARGASPVKATGWSPIHYAATAGSIPMMERLKSLGADVNAQTSSGVTPLMMAARAPSRNAVEWLLRQGAYRDVCTKEGMSPADFARNAGDTALADFLAIEKCAVKGLIHPYEADKVKPAFRLNVLDPQS